MYPQETLTSARKKDTEYTKSEDSIDELGQSII